MDITSTNFTFPVPISSMYPGTRIFDEYGHGVIANKAREYFRMEHSNLIAGLYIYRHDMTVLFWTATKDYIPRSEIRTLVTAVEGGFNWTAEFVEGAFPARNDNSPEPVCKLLGSQELNQCPYPLTELEKRALTVR